MKNMSFIANNIWDRYYYTTQEINSFSGLHWYDNMARVADPITVRFNQIDPLAEKYPQFSPYAYCANNPINFIDINGESAFKIIKSAFKISSRTYKAYKKSGKIDIISEVITEGIGYMDNIYTLVDPESNYTERTLAILYLFIGINGKDLTEIEKIGLDIASLVSDIITHIDPNSDNWDVIISETNIINFFNSNKESQKMIDTLTTTFNLAVSLFYDNSEEDKEGSKTGQLIFKSNDPHYYNQVMYRYSF
ncbi:MAG: RHS repeat-associated core domain-containing protein [Bacteroidales bacterium]